MSVLKIHDDVDEAVRFANAHSLRTAILCLLNEATYTAQELSRYTRTPASTVGYHLEVLLKAGCIERAESRQIRNFTQHKYRAVKMPFYSDEDMAALPFEKRQAIYGLIIQAAQAEALAALARGKISADPRAVMAWKWFNVDQQGREDIAAELARSWDRLQEIEAESMDRRSENGESAVTLIVSSFGFERAKELNQPAPHVQGKLVDRPS